MTFFVDHILANLMLWLWAYILFTRVAPKFIRPVDFKSFVDWNALAVFILAAFLAILTALALDKMKAAGFVKSVLKEVSTALVNISSILFVLGCFGAGPLVLCAGLAGYVIAGLL